MESEVFSSVFISLFSGGRKSFSPDEMLHISLQKKKNLLGEKKAEQKNCFSHKSCEILSELKSCGSVVLTAVS